MNTVSKTSKSTLWTVAILLMTANLIFAAPSIINEDIPGSRAIIKFPAGSSQLDFDMPPVEQENALQVSAPYQDIAAGPSRQATVENAIRNYLSAKHLIMSLLSPKLRSRTSDWENASNELNRKRSYSKYCAFNAVSCFG